MSTIYKTGTITVTNGSTTVEGVGTAFQTIGVAGGQLIFSGYSAFIEEVVNELEFTLAQPWDKPTASGVYAILLENSDAADVVDLNLKLVNALRTLSLAGIHPHDLGTLAYRNTLDAGLGPEDKVIFLRAELGQDFEYYVWNGPESTSWLGPYPVAVPPDTPADGVQSSNGSITDFIQVDQATYDALSPPNPTTVYVVI